MLLFYGCLSAILWALVTWISLGVPTSIFNALNTVTFGLFTEPLSNIQNGFDYDVSNQDMPTGVFLFLFVCAFGVYFWVIKYIEQSKFNVNIMAVVFFAILFRLILLPSYPVHENDFYRYLWDGTQIKYGINPFEFAPEDLLKYEENIEKNVYFYDYTKQEYDWTKRAFTNEEQIRLDQLQLARYEDPQWFSRIGHKWVPTIYPPTAQAIFWFCALVKQNSILFMKIVFIMFDLGVIGVLILLLRRLNMNPSFVIVYAWSPLILKEFANSGHYDSVAIFFMLLFLYLLVVGKKWFSGLSFVLAGLAKYFCFLLLPIIWREYKFKQIVVGFLISLFAFMPFWFWHGVGGDVFKGLSIYSHLWMFNGAFFTIIKLPFEWAGYTSPVVPKLICGCILMVFVGFLAIKRHRDPQDLFFKCFCALAAMFLLNPVGDPWYFSWVVPFLCFFRFRSFILLSGLLIFSYLTFITDWGRWLMVIQYGPFYLLLIWEVVRRKCVPQS